MNQEVWLEKFFELFRKDALSKQYLAELKTDDEDRCISFVNRKTGSEDALVPVRILASKSPRTALSEIWFLIESLEWDKIKDRIFFTLATTDNPSVIRIKTVYNEIDIVPKLISAATDCCVDICYFMLQMWGVSVKKMLEAAAQNTQKQSVFVKKDSSAFPGFFSIGYQNAFGRRLGASIMVDKERLDDFATREESDFWVFPISTDELLLLDANQYDIDQARRVRKVLIKENKSIVSYDIYKLDRGKGGMLYRVDSNDEKITVCG